MAIHNPLLQRKKALLLKVFNEYENYEYSLESAVTVVQEVEEYFLEMTDIDLQLSDAEKQDFTEQYQDIWKEIISKHLEILELMKEENAQVRKQMSQVNKKNHIIENYMEKNQSMFLDKQA
ncbi:hypothetical protein [Marinilactibacillus piezotolerans]|uniref:hypothetical protein n=1 Tax=Marinilactibacillus piezotolerans TaxID=258723 RepID=UPI0009B0999B|nr:hypothetical protein [Marinilactibacillus piezotolerans]